MSLSDWIDRENDDLDWNEYGPAGNEFLFFDEENEL